MDNIVLDLGRATIVARMMPATPTMSMSMAVPAIIAPAGCMRTASFALMLAGTTLMLPALAPMLGFAAMLLLPGKLTHDERTRKRLLTISIYRNQMPRNFITKPTQTYYL